MIILKFKLVVQKNFKKISILIFLFALFLPAFFFTFVKIDINYNENDNKISHKDNLNENLDNSPQLSSFLGFINLTNIEVNKTRHYHNETIPIIGELFDGAGTGISDQEVAIEINGNLDRNYNATTNSTGEFKINFTIPFSLNIYSSHEIKVNILDPIESVIQMNLFIIDTNATSYFDITSLSPAIPGENYNIIHGKLRYDNGTGIPDQLISSSWYNKTIKINDNPDFNADIDGTLSGVIPIPNDNYSDVLFLNLSYSGDPNFINKTQKENLTINIFRNITCIWDTASSASEGAYIYIRGQVLSRNNTSVKINNRDVDLFYDGLLAGSVTTDNNGTFDFRFQDPGGTRNKIIEVAVVHNMGGGINIYSNTSHNIRITSVSPSETPSTSGKSGPKDPPFFNFFLVLIPIIIGGAVAFAIYARYFLKKQKEESMLVKLPLENRIRNLKILKETGRMEESLSYLFQSIYMELINGKYGRRIKETETIRDFAIISVKNLNLNPTTIYPFIQKVEEIIYARPFIINDKDFYETIELFSPIYFELTGYNFVLNF